MADSDAPAAGPRRQQKHAVVVGAGPAGALLALHLAQLGFRVSVYEKRQPEGQGPASTVGKRTYNLVLSERALQALDCVGVALPEEVAPHYHVVFVHKLQGPPNAGRPRKRTGRAVIINRGVLASTLVQRCMDLYPEAIRFHFGQQLTGLDLAACLARFGPTDQQEGGQEVQVEYDLLVGADGANSRTRTLLAQQDPGLKVQQSCTPSEYKSASMGPARQFLPEAFPEAAGSVHAWTNSKAGDAQILGSVAGNRQLLAVLILKQGVHEGIAGEAGYQAFLAKTFPSIPAGVAKSMAAQLAAAPPSVGGISTLCSKLHSGSAVL